MNIDVINDSSEFCNNSVPCMADWNKIREKYENKNYFNTSLTYLDGLSGSVPLNTDEGSIYGAQFMPIDMKTSYYEMMTTETVQVPWLAQDQERTFMNRTKELNEEPVQSYKDLKLSSIPQEQNEKYKPLIYIEGFNYFDTEHYRFKIIMILVVIFIIYLLLKQIN